MITKNIINKCAELSELAYDTAPTIEGEKYDTQLTITKQGKFLIVAFRGTSSKKDLIQDLKRNQYNGIHLGFWQCVDEVILELVRQIKFHIDSDPRLQVVFTGHSLGGALSQVSTVEVKHRLGIDSHCIVFGSPRVGNKRFCKELVRASIGHLILFENYSDQVTWAPFFGYTKPKHFIHKLSGWRWKGEHSMSFYRELIRKTK